MRQRHLLEEQTRKMLKTIKILSEGTDSHKEFPITKNTLNFGAIRTSQEEALVKTIGESLDFAENALVYKPDTKDLVLSGKINSLNLVFQFRYNDPSGDGCYLWVQELQLTETNQKTLGKIRDAFLNWKANLLQNGDLLEKLHKAAIEN